MDNITKLTFYDNMFRNNIFVISAIAAATAMLTAITALPYAQTAVADQGGVPDDNANPVAKEPGATSNEEFFQSCKVVDTASECAHHPIAGPGQYISNYAHQVNKP